MTDQTWVRIAACEHIPAREGRAVVVGGRELAVFNMGDRFLAVDNRCPHQGGPLCDGIVTRASVVCPLHAWKVNLERGTVERPETANGCVGTYATRVEDGVVFLDPSSRTLRQPQRPQSQGGMTPVIGAAAVNSATRGSSAIPVKGAAA